MPDRVIADGLVACGLVLDRFEQQVLPPAPPEVLSFSWRPLPLAEFLEGMTIARQALLDDRACWTCEERFLDVGSGIGTRTYLAHHLGWTASGIEFYEPYLVASQELFPECTFTLAAAESFEGYGGYDLVYCYDPFVDPDRNATLAALIAAAMSPGALLFLPGGQVVNGARVGDRVWRV